MANTFKNYTARSVGASLTTVHTAPGATQTTVIGMTVANRTASAIKVAVTLHDGTADTYIVGGPTVGTMGADIPAGGSIVVVGGDQKLVMEAGDLLKVESSAASSVDTVISVLEIA
jgi:hypothetical protein